MNLFNVYSLFEITPVKGRGAYIYDKDGKEYLDFYGGHAVISIGHSHPHYIKRIKNQLEQLGFYSNSVINPLQQELSDNLEKASGLKTHDLFLINSGAEANENALKLASFYNGRSKILALNNSFHGRTSAAINVTHSGQKHQSPINKGINVTYCHHNDTEQILKEIKSGQYAAMIIEAIQGVGGLDMIKNDLLLEIESVARESDTLLIMDEVQCGYGRSGDFFAFQSSGIQPDLITMAKGMGNGFPIGGVLIKSDKIPAIPSRLGTTYGGNHLACAAGIAVLEVIMSESLVENARNRGNELRKELQSFPLIRKIKGKGLMFGVEFDFPVKSLRSNLIHSHGLFTGSSSNPNLLRLLPPLNIGDKEVDAFLTKLKNGLKHL